MKHLNTIYRLGGCRSGYDEKGAREAATELAAADLSLIERCLAIGMLDECAGGVVRFKDADWFAAERETYADRLFVRLAAFTGPGNPRGTEMTGILAHALLAFPIAKPALKALRDAAAKRVGYDVSGIDEALALAEAREPKRHQPAAAH